MDLRLGWGEVYDLPKLFTLMVEQQASDVHLPVGTEPLVRIRGDLVKTGLPSLTQKKAETILYPLISQEQKEHLSLTGDLDFSHEEPGVARFRGNYFKQRKGLGAVFRMIPSVIPTLDELDLPPVLRKIAQFKRGLVIVTGATGSGKSTTLAAIIREINNTRRAHVITIEDPLEFVHENRMCRVSHREVGTHAVSFADAIRAAIREDPDIILVGEMRDLDTISQAIRAAEMGLLVLGTLHTNSAAKAIDRMIDVFPAAQQDQIRSMLSESIKAVIAQQLLKRGDGKGRCAAVEVLLGTPGLANMIREGKTPQIINLMQTGRELGMQTMDHALIDLIKKGRIAKEIVKERVRDLRLFQRAGIHL
ncbi:MAG: type IV pilus twitching motility protein PilT [Armatimonadetes bacterium]|nr:type IV pilus twitching motility protein PilT [Armatimonadota bacterium]